MAKKTTEIKDIGLLRDALHALFLKIQEKVFAAKNNGDFVKIPYEEVNAINIDYNVGTFQYDWQNVRYYEVYDWKSMFFADFLEKDIKPLMEYKIAADMMCSTFGIPEHARHIGLTKFATYLMHRIPNNGVNEDNIQDVIVKFIRDFEILKSDELHSWRVQLWLEKLEFKGDNLSISDKVILRKPRQEDLVYRRPVRNYEDEFEKMSGKGLPSSSILEFTMIAPVQYFSLYSDLIREEIEKWIDIFRLFKVGNVFPVSQSIYPDSITENGTTENPAPPFDEGWEYKIDVHDKSSYKCYILEEENQLLIEFSTKLKPVLQNISLKNYLKGDYLNLAFHRYKDALLKSNLNVDRIVSAIGALEALLSTSSNEISYKIRIYVAGLLRFLGFNSIKVYENVKKAYDVRSKLVHGDKLSDDLLEFTRKHTHEIVNYTRLCLLISLQLKDSIRKDELIKKVNYSLVDSNTNKELGELINNNVFIPIIYPFRSIPGGDEFQHKKIVCIGWGSLIWNSGELKVKSGWNNDGPQIPVEFARESSDKRITLVIDKDSQPVQTLWALMDTENINEAIESLKKREGSGKIDFMQIYALQP